ncbi:MAG: DUF218 domain-containing protein [Clostridiaceae bacterium]|nr:DUF218 domain-containing protein [Clostridiaceae bacterium]
MLKKCLKIMVWVLSLFLVVIAFVFSINIYVINVGKKYIVELEDLPESDAVVVLGAIVYGDRVSTTLERRLNTGFEVYKEGKAPKIIVSGDHGKKYYNEVKPMRDFLLDKGVKKEDIFMDHAGFSTYDSLYRARDVFLAKNIVVVSQEEHLTRALYIARKLGLNAYGVKSKDYTASVGKVQKYREILARVKAFLQCEIFHSKPRYLGETIPVYGDGTFTWDDI